jgi:phytoene dehydrogenase-like protein
MHGRKVLCKVDFVLNHLLHVRHDFHQDRHHTGVFHIDWSFFLHIYELKPRYTNIVVFVHSRKQSVDLRRSVKQI